ncbi:MAG: GNAT family N-acetyltransferase [Ktedonobacteraceae bacterium]
MDELSLQSISILPASQEDLLPILKLFDEAVVWLNQQGMEKQWGSKPFSTSPQINEQFLGWINQETMFVVRLHDRIIRSLALNPVAPPYIANRWESFPSSAFYLEASVTSRSLIGQNIGRALLQWAEHYTRESGRMTIWLDCWDENAALVRYYQQMGFVPRGTFMVKAWRGQLFEKQIAQL